MAVLGNPRHEAFCQAYAAGETRGNAVKSYLSVYSETSYGSAGTLSCNLLKNVEIGTRIAEIQKNAERAVIRREIKERTGRLEELRKIYERIARSLEKREELSSDDAVLLREAREYMKQAAIEQGQWTEKQEHTGTVGLRDDTVRQLPEDQLRKLMEAWAEARKALPPPEEG